MSTPPTRWEQADHSEFGESFAQLIDDGTDIDGEARLVDVIAPRGATVLDAGSGMGRVGAALTARGHDVTAVEKDESLVAQSRAAYPDLPVVVSDLSDLTPARLESAGRPSSYDVVVVVGNVMVFCAEGTEVSVLSHLAALLRPGGRMLVGFQTVGGPINASSYTREAFEADAAEAGLLVQHRFGGYDLGEDDPDYAVTVLSPRSGSASPAPRG